MPETIEPAMYNIMTSEQLPADQKKFVLAEVSDSQRVVKDPTGYRMGIAPPAEVSEKMKTLANEARAYISKNKAKDRVNLEIPKMEEFVSLFRGMMMIAYPAYHGLPDWDPVHTILEDKVDCRALWPDIDWFVANETVAWFGGRELYRGKSFCEQVTGGSNEKSTFVWLVCLLRSSSWKRKGLEHLSENPLSTRILRRA